MRWHAVSCTWFYGRKTSVPIAVLVHAEYVCLQAYCNGLSRHHQAIENYCEMLTGPLAAGQHVTIRQAGHMSGEHGTADSAVTVDICRQLMSVCRQLDVTCQHADNRYIISPNCSHRDLVDLKPP